MPARIALALAQMNPTVGDIEGNLELIRRVRVKAASRGADLVVFPELMLVGYPPEDLVLRPALADAARRAIDVLAALTGKGGPGLIVGTPWRERDGRLFNTAVLLHRGRLAGRVAKHVLPNYGVFDEKRVFETGPVPGPLAFPLPDGESVRIGLMIGQDMWGQDVAEGLGESGAEILVVPTGSPFEADKQEHRLQQAVARVTESGLPLLCVNQVGGQDELVFDGTSFALDADRRLVAQAPAFTEHLLMTTWERGADDVWVAARPTLKVAPLEPSEAVYRALVLGLRDHVGKNGFASVVLELSGGIDAALAAAVAVDALGRDRVHVLRLDASPADPARHGDAAACAALLGLKLRDLAIRPAVDAFEAVLAPVPTDAAVPAAVALRARLDGVLLATIADREGRLPLATADKSMLAIGPEILHGNAAGGFAVLKDVYRTRVIELARWRNARHPADCRGPAGTVVPEGIIAAATTATVGEGGSGMGEAGRPPSFAVLDRLLHGLVEADRGPQDLIEAGEPAALVHLVQNLLDAGERSRRQAPAGVKVTARSFGRDRRYPLTNGFHGRAVRDRG